MNTEFLEKINSIDFDEITGRTFFHMEMRPEQLCKFKYKELLKITEYSNFSTLFSKITENKDYSVTPMYRMVLTLLEYCKEDSFLREDKMNELLLHLMNHPDVWKVQYIKKCQDKIIREKTPMTLILESSDVSPTIKREAISRTIKRGVLEVFCTETKSTYLHSISIGFDSEEHQPLFHEFLPFFDEAFVFLHRTAVYSKDIKDTPLSLFLRRTNRIPLEMKKEFTRAIISKFPITKKINTDIGILDYNGSLALLNVTTSELFLNTLE